MAYSLDLRNRVIELIEPSHTQKKVAAVFNISVKAVQAGGARAKVSQVDFEAYVSDNPSKTLKEIGAHFGLTYGWRYRLLPFSSFRFISRFGY